MTPSSANDTVRPSDEDQAGGRTTDGCGCGRTGSGLSRRVLLGHRDGGAPDRGRQHKQRLVGIRAHARLRLRRAVGRLLRLVAALGGGRRPGGRARPGQLPLLGGVEPHRAGGGRILPRRARPLPPTVRGIARPWRRPRRDLPSLHQPALAGRAGRLGDRPRRRALRPLLHRGRRGAGRCHGARLHPQRAERGVHDGLACRDVPARQDRRHAVTRCDGAFGGRTPSGGRRHPRRGPRHPRRSGPLHDRLPAGAGRRGAAREHPPPLRRRLPRCHQGRRLPRRPGLLAHADRSPRMGRLRRGRPRPRYGLRVLPGLPRQLPPARLGLHRGRRTAARHRERHRHHRRRATHRLRAPGAERRPRCARRRRRTCAATPTGPCSTTSNGPSATGPSSGS